MKDNKIRGHTHMQWIFALLTNTILLTYGLQIGWSSPMTEMLQSPLSPIGPLSPSVVSWIASTICVAATFATLLFTYVADKYGRKVSVILVSMLQALCWLIKIWSTSATGIIIARIFCGIASGGCFCAIPIYLKEISQESNRSIFVSMIMLFQNIGVLVMYAMGGYMDYYTVLYAVVGLPIVVTLLMLKAPESPAFLVKVGKVEEARDTLAFLRGRRVGDKQIQKEIHILQIQDDYYKSLPDISFGSIFSDKVWRKAFFLSIMVVLFQAGNGNFAILTYASTILLSFGAILSPELQSLSFPAIMMVGSLMSIVFLQKMRRKILYSIMIALTIVSFLCLSSLMLVQHQGSSLPSWLPVLSIGSSVYAYAAGVLPIPAVFMSEALNFQIRAKVMGCVVTFAWFCSFLQLAVFGPVAAILGMHTMFFIFATFNLFGLVMVLTFMPETKGKTVEEIESELRGKCPVEEEK